MSSSPLPEQTMATATASSQPPSGAPALNGADGNKLWDDVKEMFHKHKSTLLKAMVLALATYVCYLHKTIADIKSEQKVFQAQTETAIQAEFSKQKETFWKEQKQPIDSVKLFTETFECQAKLRSNNNAKRYGESIRLFQEYCKHTALDAVPFSLKNLLFEEAIRAYSIQGGYQLITDSELAYMEKVFRDDMACNLTQFYVATIYLGKGQMEKARSVCKSGMGAIQDALLLSNSVYVCRPDLGIELPDYYALMALIELATPRNRAQEAAISDCWRVLQECEKRNIVLPEQISQRLDRSSLFALVRHLKLAQPTVFADLFQSMTRELDQYVFIEDIDEKNPSNSRGFGQSEMKVKRITRSEWDKLFRRDVEVPKPTEK